MLLSSLSSPTTGRTGTFFHNTKNATLHRSAPATWTLPKTAHRSNSISSRVSHVLRRQPGPRLSLHLQQTTAVRPTAYRNTFKSASATLSGKVDGIGARLSPTKVIVIRKRRFEVPRGRRVSERMWTEFNNGCRKVTFSRNVEVRFELCVREVGLVPAEISFVRASRGGV